MKRKYKMLPLAAVLLSVTIAGSASADPLFSYVFTGTVSSLVDPQHVFGSAPAEQYTLIYEADLANGVQGGGGGGSGGESMLVGGTDNTFDPGYGDPSVSPISAVLEIGGKDLSFTGLSFGAVTNTYEYDLASSVVTGTSTSSIDARDDGADDISSMFLSNDPTTFKNVLYPTTATIDGLNVTGSTTFYLSALGVSGTLSPATYVSFPGGATISAAPEPSTWLLMLAGIGGLGLMLRQNRSEATFRFKNAPGL
ncbi:MAG: PEP-CTERM sorting domain-containing protein [Caulobacteraceae bacterium]